MEITRDDGSLTGFAVSQDQDDLSYTVVLLAKLSHDQPYLDLSWYAVQEIGELLGS